MTEETGMKGGPRMGCGARAGGIVALAVIAAVAGVIVPASAQMPPGFGVPSDPFRSEIPVADPDRSDPDGQPESKPDSKRDSKRDHRHRRPMPPPPPGCISRSAAWASAFRWRRRRPPPKRRRSGVRPAPR